MPVRSVGPVVGTAVGVASLVGVGNGGTVDWATDSVGVATWVATGVALGVAGGVAVKLGLGPAAWVGLGLAVDEMGLAVGAKCTTAVGETPAAG